MTIKNILKKVREVIAPPIAIFLKNIGFFNQAFYSARYPELMYHDVDLALHYVKHGILECRYPNQFLYSLRRVFIKQIIHVVRIILYLCLRLRFVELTLPVLDVRHDKRSWLTLTAIEDGEAYSFFEPKISGTQDAPSQRCVILPDKWMARVSHVTIVPGMQVISHHSFIMYEPAANPEHGFIAGLQRTVFPIEDDPSSVLVKYAYKEKKHLNRAILLDGRCGRNYFHWLIEYLPRLYTVEKDNTLHAVPLIVSDNLVQAQRDSLQMLVGDRPVYYLAKHIELTVGELFIPSLSTFIPDNYIQYQFWESAGICERSLGYVRARVLDAVLSEDVEFATLDRIYVARKPGARSINNDDALQEALKMLGFEVIYPENYSFSEQVRLFHRASVIVGAMGAAFANLIFCQEKTKILALCNPFGLGYSMQGNLASFAGCDYQVVAGHHPSYEPMWRNHIPDFAGKSALPLIHLNFDVDVAHVIATLKEWGV